jgi:phosphoglycerol transferase MdoB-like AlkP superfamily enzyme
MRHTDGALAGFFAALDRAGLLASTVVVVYGDHTAGLPLDADLLALAGVSEWDPSLPVRMHRVPAFVWIPGAPLAGRDDRPGGTIDLGPTALEILGVAPPTSAIGRSLLGDHSQLVALPDGSAVGDDRIWIARGRAGIAGDACVERATGRARPLPECDAVRQAAARELAVGRAVLDHDLHRAIPTP